MKRDADTDKRWMSAALNLARRGLGNVWPNPAVGCVVVSQGRVVGRGWTQPGGTRANFVFLVALDIDYVAYRDDKQ